MRPTSRLLAALATVAGLAGCGSTVHLGAGATASGADGLGLGAATPTSGATASTGDSATLGNARSKAPGSATSSTAGTSSATADGGSAGSATTGTTVVSTKTISVGISYVKPADAGLAAIGAAGVSLGDQLAYSKAVVEDANAHGGLGGRKIVPVYFGFDANPGAASIPTQEQSACATFTQDHHVELAIGTSGVNLIACLTKKGVPSINEGSSTSSVAATFAQNPMHYELGGFNLNRRAEQEIPALVRLKYFAGWNTSQGAPGTLPAKIGVVTYNTPEFSSSAHGSLVQAITNAGLAKPDVVEVAYHDSYANLASAQSQVQGAVLRFKAMGITHVIVWDDNGISTLFFMINAENQGYRPRYGINSGNNMQLIVSKKLANQAQAHGAIGFGWRAVEDIGAGADKNGKYSNAPRKACDKLMAAHGASTSDPPAEAAALGLCAGMNAVKSRYDGLPAPTRSAFLAAMDSFGSAFTSPVVPGTFLSASRHDGLAATYDFGFDSACTCMTFRGSPQPLAR